MLHAALSDSPGASRHHLVERIKLRIITLVVNLRIASRYSFWQVDKLTNFFFSQISNDRVNVQNEDIRGHIRPTAARLMPKT
jgi:hypothetical protein